MLENNPSILCIFQAAEIDRLKKCLEEYRAKFMRQEKLNVDRHLYEIQIQELTEMLKKKDDL